MIVQNYYLTKNILIIFKQKCLLLNSLKAFKTNEESIPPERAKGIDSFIPFVLLRIEVLKMLAAVLMVLVIIIG